MYVNAHVVHHVNQQWKCRMVPSVIYIHTHIYIHIYTYTYIRAYVYTHIYTSIRKYTGGASSEAAVEWNACVCVCVCACMCVYMCS